MAQTKERAIVEKIYEMTERGELTWNGNESGYLAEHDLLILQLFKEEHNEHFLQIDGGTEIRNIDIGYSGRLEELELLVRSRVAASWPPQRPAYDHQGELQSILDQLSTKA